MPEAPAYQSGLIAALRGGSPQASQVSVPGVTMMPNAPRPSGSPSLFGGAPMTGNLMTPPSFPLAQGAMPRQSQQQQPLTATFMGMPLQIPREFAPQMSGNLMPVPQFSPAPDYVAPPPQPMPTYQPPPYFQNPESGYRWVYNADGDQVPYYDPNGYYGD